MTDQQLWTGLQELVRNTTLGWFVAALLGAVLGLRKSRERALAADRDAWRGKAAANQALADKNYAAGLSWKKAFETGRAPSKAAPKRKRGKMPQPALGHCHDQRCEARDLKLHACHDLTCKLHVHETRAR